MKGRNLIKRRVYQDTRLFVWPDKGIGLEPDKDDSIKKSKIT
jgi:hypothetical protein